MASERCQAGCIAIYNYKRCITPDGLQRSHESSYRLSNLNRCLDRTPMTDIAQDLMCSPNLLGPCRHHLRCGEVVLFSADDVNVDTGQAALEVGRRSKGSTSRSVCLWLCGCDQEPDHSRRHEVGSRADSAHSGCGYSVSDVAQSFDRGGRLCTFQHAICGERG